MSSAPPVWSATVTFAPADTTPAVAVDQAYRAKYGRYAGSYLEPMLTDQAAAATLLLAPQD